MSLIKWQDSFSVGVDLIDADHKLLVSLINQLYDAQETGQGEDVVGSALNVLCEYTETHFAREEMLMEKGGYPDLEEHKKLHVKLAGQVRDIVQRYGDGDSSAVNDELLAFLSDWLTGHILGVDMKYRPFVEGITLTPQELLASFNLDEDA